MLRTLGIKIIVCHAHTSATQRAHTNNTTQSSQPTPHHHHCCGCHLHHNHNYNNYKSNPIRHSCYLHSKSSVCNCNSWLIAGAKCFAPSALRLFSATRAHTHQPHNPHTHTSLHNPHNQRITTIAAVIYTTITTTTTTNPIPSCILATYTPN